VTWLFCFHRKLDRIYRIYCPKWKTYFSFIKNAFLFFPSFLFSFPLPFYFPLIRRKEKEKKKSFTQLSVFFSCFLLWFQIFSLSYWLVTDPSLAIISSYCVSPDFTWTDTIKDNFKSKNNNTEQGGAVLKNELKQHTSTTVAKSKDNESLFSRKMEMEKSKTE